MLHVTNSKLRIGFVATRLAGTDGVSLESAKWSQVLTDLGHECFYFAGECDRPASRSAVVPEAHFQHEDVLAINQDLFDDYRRTPQTSEEVSRLRRQLKHGLHRFIDDFGVQLLIVENALSIPMNVPLGLALTECIAETRIPTIAHHHDFAWERMRFAVHAAEDYLSAAFPPPMTSVHHVVINTYAAAEVARRTGMRSTIVPNVMDFDRDPPPADDYAAGLRDDFGVAPEEKLLLQPTRVVPRKRIERAIELARAIQMPCTLLVSHATSDEGSEYRDYLADYARIMGVRLVLAEGRFNHHRGTNDDGRPIYALADAYSEADLVTYPSRVEGFGNAFLEAIYHRRPLMMSSYEIFKTDIQPKGFEVIAFGEFVSHETAARARAVLDDPASAQEMIERNYRLGRLHYSYTVLRNRLEYVMQQTVGQQY